MSHCFTSDLRRWDVCVGLLPSRGAGHFVEVGTKDGRTASAVLKALPGITVTAIDPWIPLPNASEDYSDHNFKEIERKFWENVGPHRDRVKMLRMTSEDAADRFNVESDPCRALLYTSENGMNGAEFDVLPPIDLVFIDAGHDFANCLADIQAWWPLVREGGFLAGHDYNHKFPGVMQAVAKCFPLMNVAVCPDSVWVVQKTPQLARLAA